MVTVWGSLPLFQVKPDEHIQFFSWCHQQRLGALMGKLPLPALWFPGKEDDVDDHDLERFKEEIRKFGIPEENIVDFTKGGKWNYIFFLESFTP